MRVSRALYTHNKTQDQAFSHAVRTSTRDRSDPWHKAIIPTYDPNGLLGFRNVYLLGLSTLNEQIRPFGECDLVVYPGGAGDILTPFAPQVLVTVDKAPFEPAPVTDMGKVYDNVHKLLSAKMIYGYMPGDGKTSMMASFDHMMASLFIQGIDPRKTEVSTLSKDLFLIEYEMAGETRRIYYLQQVIEPETAAGIARRIDGIQKENNIGERDLLIKADLENRSQPLLPRLNPRLVVVDDLAGYDQAQHAPPLSPLLADYGKYPLNARLEIKYGYAQTFAATLFVR